MEEDLMGKEACCKEGFSQRFRAILSNDPEEATQLCIKTCQEIIDNSLAIHCSVHYHLAFEFGTRRASELLHDRLQLCFSFHLLLIFSNSLFVVWVDLVWGSFVMGCSNNFVNL